MGKEGCKFISKNRTFTVNTTECKVIDKTGAGDVVTGVFLEMMAKTNNPIEALQTAVNMATLSIKDYGVDFLSNYI